MPYFIVSYDYDCSSLSEIEEFKADIAQALDIFLHYSTLTKNTWIVHADQSADVVGAMRQVVKSEGLVVAEIADIEFRDLGESTEEWIVEHLKSQT